MSEPTSLNLDNNIELWTSFLLNLRSSERCIRNKTSDAKTNTNRENLYFSKLARENKPELFRNLISRIHDFEDNDILCFFQKDVTSKAITMHILDEAAKNINHKIDRKYPNTTLAIFKDNAQISNSKASEGDISSFKILSSSGQIFASTRGIIIGNIESCNIDKCKFTWNLNRNLRKEILSPAKKILANDDFVQNTFIVCNDEWLFFLTLLTVFYDIDYVHPIKVDKESGSPIPVIVHKKLVFQ